MKQTKFIVEKRKGRYFACPERDMMTVEDVHAAAAFAEAEARKRCAEIRSALRRCGVDVGRFPRVVKVVTETSVV